MADHGRKFLSPTPHLRDLPFCGFFGVTTVNDFFRGLNDATITRWIFLSNYFEWLSNTWKFTSRSFGSLQFFSTNISQCPCLVPFSRVICRKSQIFPIPPRVYCAPRLRVTLYNFIKISPLTNYDLVIVTNLTRLRTFAASRGHLKKVKVKVKASHTRYRALGPELIPVYRQSACRWP